MHEFELQIIDSKSPSETKELIEYIYRQPIEGIVSVDLKKAEIRSGEMGAFDDTIKIIVDGLSRPFTKLAEALNKKVEAQKGKFKFKKPDGTVFEYEGGNVKMLEAFLSSNLAK